MNHLKLPNHIAIIGAGPIGIYLTDQLLKQGWNVHLFEAGFEFEESDHLNLKHYIFTTESAIPKNVHRVGGGTNFWRGRLSEFQSKDFSNRLEVVGASWSFGKDELAKFYLEVYKILITITIIILIIKK